MSLTMRMKIVSDQIIHSKICLKNVASSCGGLLTAFPSYKNIYESTIGNLRISRCQSTIQACKTDSPRLRNLIYPKAVFIKKFALSPTDWFWNLLVSCWKLSFSLAKGVDLGKKRWWNHRRVQKRLLSSQITIFDFLDMWERC